MNKCCPVAPYVIKSDNKKYCLDCGSEIIEQKNINDLQWDDLFGTPAYQSTLKCQCGSESVGSNKHSTWCQKYSPEGK